MASAMVDGLVSADPANQHRIRCFSPSGSSAQALALRTGISQANDLPELLADASLVVVAFKPQHLATADPRLAELTVDKIVISVLAAKTLDQLAVTFPQARAIVRTMPNTPSAIGAGITGWCCRPPLQPADQAAVIQVLEAIGQTLEVPESKIDALMAVSGCGPAFVFEFTAALREGGVAAGLTHEEASTLAIETVLGSARLMARSDKSPEALRDQVTSPNGTTFAGLQQMAAHDFRGLMHKVVMAAKARSEELAKGA